MRFGVVLSFEVKGDKSCYFKKKKNPPDQLSLQLIFSFANVGMAKTLIIQAFGNDATSKLLMKKEQKPLREWLRTYFE